MRGEDETEAEFARRVKDFTHVQELRDVFGHGINEDMVFGTCTEHTVPVAERMTTDRMVVHVEEGGQDIYQQHSIANFHRHA